MVYSICWYLDKYIQHVTQLGNNRCSSSLSLSPVSLSGLPLNQSIGTAVTPANTPNDHAIVFHPNLYVTNPPHNGPKNNPRNCAIVWIPNACATAPFWPKIPGSARSISSSTCCVSTKRAGTLLFRSAPIRVKRIMRRTLWGLSLCSTRRRQMSGGPRRRKLVKVTMRLP